MEKNNKIRALALRKELEATILEKLEAIKEKVLTDTSHNPVEEIQILFMVNDELDDVLLNWNTSDVRASLLPNTWLDNDYDDDEDD